MRPLISREKIAGLADCIGRALSSIALTAACLFGVMVLVLLGTLEEVRTGIYYAQNIYFRSFLVYWQLKDFPYRIPYFPGGYAFGALLLLNLFAAYWYHFQLSWKKTGIAFIHLGIALLIIAEMITGLCSQESQMAIKVGQSMNYSESLREMELVVADTTNANYNHVVTIPEKQLSAGLIISLPTLPLTLKTKTVYPNSRLSMREEEEEKAAPSPSYRGIGGQVQIDPLPPVTRDDRMPTFTAVIELKDKEFSLGEWVLSNAIPIPQSFRYENKDYELAIRRKRYYYPFRLKLVDFKKETYSGTEIPKSFSSQVTLFNDSGELERQAVISMNQPLRYEGKTFYQASYGDEGSLSVLQVVENPGRWLPYLSSSLVTVGLILQFFVGFYDRRGRSFVRV
ncbi:MAG: cytochrome c biogenesis protein ResB [Waddliaceae bacterium]